MNTLTLPKDVWVNIGYYLNKHNLSDLLVLRRVSKQFYSLFTYMVSNLDIDLSNYCESINNENLKLFRGVKFLSLWNCQKITDEGLRNLQTIDGTKTVKKLDLTYCRNITDEGMFFIDDIREINLVGCYISDYGLEPIKMVENIKLDYRSIITDKGLSKLKNLKLIDTSLTRITNDGFKNLNYVEHVQISSSSITDDCLRYFKNAKVVNLHSCEKITNEGIKEHLINVPQVYINYCSAVKPSFFKLYKNISVWP